MQSTVERMIDNVERVLVGKREVVELTMTALISGGHVLLEDVPGVGKTTLANAVAKTISCGFSRIQFTPDTLPGDITGVSIYNMKTASFEYSKGSVMNNIILADEINRTSPKTQASLLEAMEEGQVSVDGVTHEIPKPFMVIATQNPADYLGTYNLPEAQLDRFLMKLSIGYPDTDSENQMVKRFLDSEPLKTLEAVTDGAEISEIQQAVRQIAMHDDLTAYLVTLIEATRSNPNISLGASPRSALALARAAQATAYLQGRDYVIPDDIKKMAKPVLGHRLVVTPEARLNKQTPDRVLTYILGMTKVPIL